jgi:hypothetical protein
MKIATFNINNVNKRLAKSSGVASRFATRRGLPSGTEGRPIPSFQSVVRAPCA